MKQLQGFVAGTLVHTDKGLVPIEQIKVGDMVLSKPEIGEGELAYKPVVNTFVHEDKEVWLAEFNSLSCYTDEQFDSGEVPYRSDAIVGTPNHPFWVVGEINHYDDMALNFYPKPCWKRLDQLQPYMVILHADGFLASVYAVQPIFTMSNPDRGFLQGYPLGDWWEHEHGSYIDLNTPPKIYHQRFDSFFNKDMKDNTNDWGYTPKTQKVYNFEVADYHTYFVGEGGIWVHHTNGYLTQ